MATSSGDPRRAATSVSGSRAEITAMPYAPSTCRSAAAVARALRGRAEALEAAVHDREPCRVIAAILKALQAFEHERRRRSLARVAYDAAHDCRPSSIKRCASALVGASAIKRIIGSVP